MKINNYFKTVKISYNQHKSSQKSFNNTLCFSFMCILLMTSISFAFTKILNSFVNQEFFDKKIIVYNAIQSGINLYDFQRHNLTEEMIDKITEGIDTDAIFYNNILDSNYSISFDGIVDIQRNYNIALHIPKYGLLPKILEGKDDVLLIGRMLLPEDKMSIMIDEYMLDKLLENNVFDKKEDILDKEVFLKVGNNIETVKIVGVFTLAMYHKSMSFTDPFSTNICSSDMVKLKVNHGIIPQMQDTDKLVLYLTEFSDMVRIIEILNDNYPIKYASDMARFEEFSILETFMTGILTSFVIIFVILALSNLIGVFVMKNRDDDIFVAMLRLYNYSDLSIISIKLGEMSLSWFFSFFKSTILGITVLLCVDILLFDIYNVFVDTQNLLLGNLGAYFGGGIVLYFIIMGITLAFGTTSLSKDTLTVLEKE